MVLRLVLGVLCAVVLFSGMPAGAVDRPMPSVIDPAKRYLFYMHGIYVERQGAFEQYQYHDILDAIEAQGFVVIGEARGLTNAGRYAKVIAKQVQALLDAGVPSYQITVAGHSKGGLIALYAAALLDETGVNYVVFAGCGKAGTEYRRDLNKFMKLQTAPIEGNFLVAWAEDDMIAADCDDALKGGKAVIKNKVLPTGYGGHKMFYTPEPLWLNELTAFASGG